MEELLQRIAASDDIGLEPLRELIASLRPRHAKDAAHAADSVRALAFILQRQPILRDGLRRYLLRFIAGRKQVHLYSDTGIYANEGLLSAAWRRICQRLLPEARSPLVLRDAFSEIFERRDDIRWLRAVPETVWLELLEVLQCASGPELAERQRIATEVLDALLVLSYRISSIGLEPELVRNYPDIERFESPFLTQNVEMRAYVESHLLALRQPEQVALDDKHLHVLLEQCTAIADQVLKNAQHEGISISLTYLLQRLRQSVARMYVLLELLEPDVKLQRQRQLLRFWLELVAAESRKHSVRDLFAHNTAVLALQVTEHAGRTGEHYVTSTRSEYWAMLRSGLGAGFVVGFMALIKIFAAKLHAPPLVEAFLFSCNYAFGFMLIYALHFTLATKQPAMTAAHIAASIHQQDDLESLADLIVRVARTQFIAIVGNVVLAFPTALAIAMLGFWATGSHWIPPDKAQHLLSDIDPWHSLALFHAAIAGVCLFLAGLISGYHDNKALYNRIPQRLRQLRGLQRLLGVSRLDRLAAYIENHLGGLAGNFYFGFMLGSMGTLGFLLGLPIDIRHITFSAANYAYALVALNFHLPWQTALNCALGVALIGLTNLLVSFFLALVVALRARQVKLSMGGHLLKHLAWRLLRHPTHFLWPPRVVIAEPAIATATESE